MCNNCEGKIIKLYNNCMDCPNHKVEHDPDPTDSFCDDDQAVLCTLAKNINNQHRWADNHVWDHRPITWSCRPHHKRVECITPSWCPLIKKLTYDELSAHASHCGGSSANSEGHPIECPICLEFSNRTSNFPKSATPCVCEGNWREIIKETEGKIGKTFIDPNKKEWVLDGILWAEDDFYYLFANDGELKYCSCVATLNVYGMKEKE